MNALSPQPAAAALAGQEIARDETSNLDVTVAQYVLPRLKAFDRDCDRSPSQLTMDQWHGILGKMIYAFERIATSSETDTPECRDYLAAVFNMEEDLEQLRLDAHRSMRPISEGLELFHKYYRNLWW